MLLLNCPLLIVLAEDRCNFPLHKRPGNVRANQRTLLPAWTVHFRSCTLTLDTVPRAGEAELVFWHRRTLHEVGVFESFETQCTFEGLRVR